MTSSAEIFNELKNPQLGSSFGFAMTSSDLDGDEVDELLIGAPSWGEQQQGRVFIYSSVNFSTPIELNGNDEAFSRFGYVITTADLNRDGLNDVIIGAPSNEQLRDGAIYIFNGNADDVINRQPSQVIRARSRIAVPVLFGASITSGFDLDGNGICDVAVAAPTSGRVYVLLSRPVFIIKLNVSMIKDPQTLLRDPVTIATNHTFPIKLCFDVSGEAIPDVTELIYHVTVNRKRSRFYQSLIRVNKSACDVIKFNFQEKDLKRILIIDVTYKLSKQMTSQHSIFHIHPNSTSLPFQLKIPFQQRCSGPRCIADLRVTSTMTSLPKGRVRMRKNELTLTGSRGFAISVKLRNLRGIATNPSLLVTTMTSLHLFSNSSSQVRC